MAVLTVRNLDPEVHKRLREQAARNGRSMEAEARAILDAGVRKTGSGLASALRMEEDVELDLDIRYPKERATPWDYRELLD